MSEAIAKRDLYAEQNQELKAEKKELEEVRLITLLRKT